MLKCQYRIAWKSTISDPVSFGPGPDGEDQIAPILESASTIFETLKEACEYLDSINLALPFDAGKTWGVSAPYIIKTIYSPKGD